MPSALCSSLNRLIIDNIDSSFVATKLEAVGGGCINRCYKISGKGRRAHSYFIKQHQADRLDNFRAEKIGLQQLAATQTLKVPEPLLATRLEDTAVLILEALDMNATNDISGWKRMGTQLAQLHLYGISQLNRQLPKEAQLPSDCYGVRIPNASLAHQPGFIAEHKDWATYFCRHRLEFQFNQAKKKHIFPMQEELLKATHKLLSHKPPYALVHGDLWGGNADFALIAQQTRPVVFDPAAYVADPETDLAMTELFGGFPEAFYEGYKSIHPLDAKGYAQRRDVYNLYHILNHYNLFGGAYLHQAESMIRRICNLSRQTLI